MYSSESNERVGAVNQKITESNIKKNHFMGTGLLEMYSTVYLNDCFAIP